MHNTCIFLELSDHVVVWLSVVLVFWKILMDLLELGDSEVGDGLAPWFAI